jgi:hypothetical protein
VIQSCHFQIAGLASIFHSKFKQEIVVSDWIIRSAHAQTDCLQMRSPLSFEMAGLGLVLSALLASFSRDKTHFLLILSRLLKLWIGKSTSVEAQCDFDIISGFC